MKKTGAAPKVGVGALIIRDGQVLLAKRRGSHGQGTYGSVGGHLEFGESAETALKREAREELGIELGNLAFIACTNAVMYGQHYIDLGFRADIVAGTPVIQPEERHKIESVSWYKLDALPHPLFEPIKIYLKALASDQHFYEIRS